MMKRNQIIYLPFPVKGNRINEYTQNMVNILRQKYSIVANLAEPTNVMQMLRTKAVFLNWVEDDLDSKTKIQIWLHRLFGAKVVWVFHNKYPHDSENNAKIAEDMKWLADQSSIILLHAKSSKKFIPNYSKNYRKAVYVPHILYDNIGDTENLSEIQEKYGVEKTDFVFLIFGSIRPYKNIEMAIAAFNSMKCSDAKLVIAGMPKSQEYANKLIEKAKLNPNIVLDFRFIPEKRLVSLIKMADIVVIPYKDGSSLNSGVMIQAFSLGRTVIAPDMCMTRDFMKQGFLYAYKNNLEKAMRNAMGNSKITNDEMGRRAQQYMEKYHNSQTVGRILINYLEK